MALEYFLYRTDLENTLVDRSTISFVPLPPNTNEVLIDFLIPQTQPLYLYRYDGNTIIINSDKNIEKYLQETEGGEIPVYDDPINHETFTGYTASTESKFNEYYPKSGDTIVDAPIHFGVETSSGYTGSIGIIDNKMSIKSYDDVVFDTQNLIIKQVKDPSYKGAFMVIGDNGKIIYNKIDSDGKEWIDDTPNITDISDTNEHVIFNLNIDDDVNEGTLDWVVKGNLPWWRDLTLNYKLNGTTIKTDTVSQSGDFNFTYTQILTEADGIVNGSVLELTIQASVANYTISGDYFKVFKNSSTVIQTKWGLIDGNIEDQHDLIEKFTGKTNIITGATNQVPIINADGCLNASGYYISGLTGGSSSIPTLQEVTDCGNITTNNILIGDSSSQINGNYSFAHGCKVCTFDHFSHAEGCNSKACGFGSHAEGRASCSIGYYSHSEGYFSKALGHYSHAEGYNTCAISSHSHSEGYYGKASGCYSHAEGMGSESCGDASHAEGYYTKAVNAYSHAEGGYSLANGFGSHAGGFCTIADGVYQTVYGRFNKSVSSTTFIIGAGINATSRENSFEAYCNGDIAFPKIASGITQYALYINNNGIVSFGDAPIMSIPTLQEVTNSGNTTTNSILIGDSGSNASGCYSFAHGCCVQATNTGSHVEGYFSTVNGNYSHAEGYDNIVCSDYSHVEGRYNVVTGFSSHVEGLCNIGNANFAHISGKYNIGKTNILFEIGAGSDNYNRNNALEVDNQGKISMPMLDTSNNSDYILYIDKNSGEITKGLKPTGSTGTGGTLYNFIESGGTKINVNNENVTIYSSEIIYDGYDLENNILNLSGVQYQNQKWFATDTKYVYKYIEFNGEWAWIGKNLHFNNVTGNYELPKDATGYIHTIGKEAFMNAINTETSGVTAPHIFILSDINAIEGDFIDAKLAIESDIGSTSVYGVNATNVNANDKFKLIVFGIVSNIDTSTWVVNSKLYISDIDSGKLIDTPPNEASLPIGYVLKQDSVNGVIFIDCIRQSKNTPVVIPVNFNNIYLTSDITSLDGTDYYKVLSNDKGINSGEYLEKSVYDNEKLPLDMDFVSLLTPIKTKIYKGVYDAQLQVIINDRSASEKLYIEVYYATITGAPIDSGISNTPIGDLGVKPIFTMESSLLNLNINYTQNVYLSGQLDDDFEIESGRLLRYHILVEKVGASNEYKSFKIFIGKDNNSFIRSPFRFKLNDLNDVDTENSNINDVLTKNSSGLWVGSPLPQSLNSVSNLGNGISILNKNGTVLESNTLKGKGGVYVYKSGDTVNIDYVTSGGSGFDMVYLSEYYYLNYTNDSDPGITYMKINNTDPTLVTEAYIDYQNINQIDCKYTWLNAKVGDTFYLRDKENADINYTYTINADPIDMGGYVKLLLTYVSSNGTPPYNRILLGLVSKVGGGSSGTDISDVLNNKIDLLSNPVEDNIPLITSNGMLKDSNKTIDDLIYNPLTGIIQLTDTIGGQNFNMNESNAISVRWDTVQYIDNSYYTFNSFNGTGNTITILKSGFYEINYNINALLDSTDRSEIAIKFYVNGVDIKQTLTASYARNTTNAHLSNTLPSYLISLSENDVVELKGYNVGTIHNVYTIAYSSFIKLKYLGT